MTIWLSADSQTAPTQNGGCSVRHAPLGLARTIPLITGRKNSPAGTCCPLTTSIRTGRVGEPLHPATSLPERLTRIVSAILQRARGPSVREAARIELRVAAAWRVQRRAELHGTAGVRDAYNTVRRRRARTLLLRPGDVDQTQQHRCDRKDVADPDQNQTG